MSTIGVAAPSVAAARARPVVRRLDVPLFVISAVVVLDTLGATAAAGAEGLTWMLVMGALFLVPSALVIAELAARLPQAGGHYVWTRLAFGRTIGAVSSLLYWVETPIWIGGSLAITALATIDASFGHVDGPLRLGAALGFVAACTAAAALPLRIGRLVPATGAAARVALLALFGVGSVAFGLRQGFHGLDPAGLVPSRTGLVALVPVLLYNFLGFDVPASAAGEVDDASRSIPTGIRTGTIATLLLYTLPLLAILLLLPTGQARSLTGFIDAMRAAYTPFGGSIGADGSVHLAGLGLVLADLSALVFLWVLLTSGATWLLGSVRSQAVACLDGAGPRWLGETAANGVPRRLVEVSGGVGAVVCVAAFAVADGNAERYFSAALSLSIAVIALSYLAVFAALPVLRARETATEGGFRIPGGRAGALAASTLAAGWTLVALAEILWPGLGTADADASLPAGFGSDRLGFEAAELVPLIVLVAAGVGFRLLGGRPHRAAARLSSRLRAGARPSSSSSGP